MSDAILTSIRSFNAMNSAAAFGCPYNDYWEPTFTSPIYVNSDGEWHLIYTGMYNLIPTEETQYYEIFALINLYVTESGVGDCACPIIWHSGLTDSSPKEFDCGRGVTGALKTIWDTNDPYGNNKHQVFMQLYSIGIFSSLNIRDAVYQIGRKYQ